MSERYMRAYYHEFTPTGDDKVDAILEAVALAGKAYHNTEQWDEADGYGERGFWSLIQQRADEAAERTAPTSAAGATKPNELTSSPEPAPALRAAEWVDEAMRLAERIEAAGARRGREGKAPSDHEPEMNALRAHLSRASGLLPVAREGLSEEALLNACLSYRHDFGLMPESERAMLMFEAGEWARAFGLKVEPTTTDATRAVLRAHLSSVAPASGDAPGEAK